MAASMEKKQIVDICLHGHGIVCGLTVQVNPNCDIELGKGTAIAGNGTVITVPGESFSYYLKVPSNVVQKYFPHSWNEKNRANRPVLELVPRGEYDAKTMDSFKQQSPKDLPTRNLLDDKIAVILIPDETPDQRYFLLVSPSVLVERDPDLLLKVKALAKNDIVENRNGIFKRPGQSKAVFSSEIIAQALYPHLQLPRTFIPRFGYKTLAIVDPGQPFGTPNFQNPFEKVKLFQDIFYEYKAILDDFVPRFCDVLEKLHDLYGSRLSHKGKGYWTQYRHILSQKWQAFLQEGEYLFYVQYFYDWLTDLVKAYDELCVRLAAFHSSCNCGHEERGKRPPYTLIHLGPVLGGRTSYTPTNFRDYYVPPMINGNAEEQWNEIRFLHWRLMMMIWTFDLPQLKLDEKVLVAGGYIAPAKEFEDSTNYFENTNTDDDPVVNLDDLPLKFTPGQTPDAPLGEQAIPYYYPLDADSPYSLHRYWNYQLTQMGQIARIRSYNGNKGRDSYTSYRDTLFPLAFHLRNEPFLRTEGHIGKQTDIDVVLDPAKVSPDWAGLLDRYNLTANILLVPVSQLRRFVQANALSPLQSQAGQNSVLQSRIGLEHTGGIGQGQTLVLVYADSDEQIELSECKKDVLPEVKKLTIVADFTIPLANGLRF
jgi:hypothetical protein